MQSHYIYTNLSNEGEITHYLIGRCSSQQFPKFELTSHLAPSSLSTMTAGGRIDYGEEHSEQCGHNRFSSNELEGKLPGWSATTPIHFVGHSFGGNTIRYLPSLLFPISSLLPYYRTISRALSLSLSYISIS